MLNFKELATQNAEKKYLSTNNEIDSYIVSQCSAEIRILKAQSLLGLEKPLEAQKWVPSIEQIGTDDHRYDLVCYLNMVINSQCGDFQNARKYAVLLKSCPVHFAPAIRNIAIQLCDEKLWHYAIAHSEANDLLTCEKALWEFQNGNFDTGSKMFSRGVSLGFRQISHVKDLDDYEFIGARVYGKKSCSGAIAIIFEQGVGDSLLHLGFMNEFRKRASPLHLLADHRLRPFFDAVFGKQGYHIYPNFGAFKNFLINNQNVDVLMSQDIFLENFLEPKARVKFNRPNVDTDITGISWRGGGNAARQNRRNIDLGRLVDHVNDEYPGSAISALQYDVKRNEMLEIENRSTGKRFVHTGIDRTNNIFGWFQLLSESERVMTVDNITPIACGLLGIPTKLYLSDARHWYWSSSYALNKTVFPNIEILPREVINGQ